MGIDNKIDYLIVDTSAFIKNVPLQEVGNNIITEQSVVAEITNKRQLRRLVVLPYDLMIKDVFSENIQFVTEFSKKTGDYTSLSATDIKVIALTYQLEKEKVGTDHLKTAPSIVKTVPAVKSEPLAHPKSIAGFYVGHENDSENDDDDNNVELNKLQDTKENEDKSTEIVTQVNEQLQYNESQDVKKLTSPSIDLDESNDESDIHETTHSDTKRIENLDLTEKFAKLNCNANDLELECGDQHSVDDILAASKQEFEDQSEYYEFEDSSDDESDDGGWITPSNIAQAKKQIHSDMLSEKPVKVACMTTDFAMQNVLMQIGLNVAALDGRVIKQMRTFIFRCYACFRTTSIMTKVFCPHCGLKTLKKVAVSLDDEGNEKIHINFRKPLSARGKKFSLPMPKGGKHANNPILCEDQPRPDQRPTRLARMKNDPLNDDYIAGYSPFVMRDVYSKSAMLGIRSDKGGNFKYWMKKNPNEARRKRK